MSLKEGAGAAGDSANGEEEEEEEPVEGTEKEQNQLEETREGEGEAGGGGARGGRGRVRPKRRRRRSRRTCLGRLKDLWDEMRRKLWGIVESKYFSRGIMMAILINTISMGIEHHNQVRPQPGEL